MIGASLVSTSINANSGIPVPNHCIGTFVAAPIGGLIWGFGAFFIRVSLQWISAKVGGRRFDSFDPPMSSDTPEAGSDEDQEPVTHVEASSVKGKFF